MDEHYEKISNAQTFVFDTEDRGLWIRAEGINSLEAAEVADFNEIDLSHGYSVSRERGEILPDGRLDPSSRSSEAQPFWEVLNSYGRP